MGKHKKLNNLKNFRMNFYNYEHNSPCAKKINLTVDSSVVGTIPSGAEAWFMKVITGWVLITTVAPEIKNSRAVGS